jgi:hypothetical protein
MFNRERVILTIEPQATLWYKGIILFGSFGLPQAKFTNALTLGDFDEVSRTGFEPMHLSASFNKHLNIARKNEEDFHDIVAVHGYRNAGRDRSFQYVRGFVALLRTN